MNLLAVPPSLAPQAWEKARDFISAACTRLDLADAYKIEADVLAGNAILWLAVDGNTVVGAGVTQLFEQAGHKVCEIVAWGSKDQAKCTPLLREIERFAKSEGCDCVRIVGRKGWARHLDYGVKALILEKAI